MKIEIPPLQEVRDTLTLADMPKVREIRKQMKEDGNLLDYLTSAARVAANGNFNFSVYDAHAFIAKNGRVSDYYTHDSGNLDIWLEGLAFDPFAGAYMIGVYLSDVYNITGDNNSEIKEHMFIREYTPKD